VNIRRHFKPPSEREIARQQSVSERRQGANRTSSGVNLVNCRLETPPEASLTCPSAFETAAQVMHTMRVKISQDFLLQPSHAQAHLEWQREAGARTCPEPELARTQKTHSTQAKTVCAWRELFGGTQKKEQHVASARGRGGGGQPAAAPSCCLHFFRPPPRY
jgi:hypothetical protein